MSPAPIDPITSGPAFRVTILGQQQAEAYHDVHAVLDSEHGVVHVLSADAQTHYLTIPMAAALVEWQDPSALQPALRIPPFGPGAYQHFAEGMQRFVGEIGGAFGHET